MRARRFTPVAALVAVLATAALVAGCGGGNSSGNGGSKDNVNLTQGRNLTIAMVTHGAGDTFWAVVKKGAEQAAKDMGVKLNYQESANDPQRQAQEIEAAVTSKVDGIAVSVPNPDAIKDALAKAKNANI